MTIPIIVHIEAGEKGCGECEYDDIRGECRLFGEGLKYNSSFTENERCPACLEAEAKVKELIEAAGGARRFIWERPEIAWDDELILKLDAALAAVKEQDDEHD